MGVPGGPILAIRVCQTRVMMMIRFQQRLRATGTRRCGKSVWQEDLEEQCGNRHPGRDFASDSIAHPRLALPAVAMRAKHLRCYQMFRWHVDARATLNPGIIGGGDQPGTDCIRAAIVGVPCSKPALCPLQVVFRSIARRGSSGRDRGWLRGDACPTVPQG